MKLNISAFILITAALLLLGPNIHAATINTLSISGLPTPSKVEAFNVWYQVTPDFSILNASVDGSAIPPDITFGWAVDGQTVSNSEFRFAGSNTDGWVSGNENPMRNGNFASFEYEGGILDVNFFQFGDIIGTPIDTIFLASLDQNNTNFAVVPIPSTIILLGGGLVGLICLRRRRQS